MPPTQYAMVNALTVPLPLLLMVQVAIAVGRDGERGFAGLVAVIDTQEERSRRPC